MMPIRKGDGTGISDVRLGDGTGISEVRKGDGTVLWSAGGDIPDSGLLHNYDARSLSLNEGDLVSTWGDSEAGDDLTTGNAPTYRANDINGNPAVEGDGVDDYLTTSFSTTITQPFDVFIVGRLSGSTGTQRLFGSTDVVETAHSFTNNRHDLFGGSLLSGGSPTTGEQLMTYTLNGASSEIRKNQSSLASGDAGAANLTAVDVLRSANNISYWDGSIGHFLIYDADASGYNRTDVEQYLDSEWGPF